MAALQLDGVGKTYPNGVVALRNVSLRIADGECVVVVGPSGSGKSTLLRLLAGLEVPTAGQILQAGLSTRRLPPHRRDVALVFQKPALYPHLTVRQNLAFGSRLRRSLVSCWFDRSTATETTSVEATAQLLGLETLLERRPADLSGGQQQRVALGRALVREPGVLLLDEPLAHLDPGLRREMRDELHLLRGRLRATILYASHDHDDALLLGERVVVLHGGVVQQVDPGQSIYNNPVNRFVAGFFGRRPMNFVDGRLMRSEATSEPEFIFTTPGGTVKVPARLSPYVAQTAFEVTLGLRPEHVELADSTAPEGRLELDLVDQVMRGGENLVEVGRGSWSLSAVCRERLPVTVGAPIQVAFDWRNVRWFDVRTGSALTALTDSC